MLRPPSLRTRFLLIVLVGAVLPLGLIGFWLTRTSLRSGEELLSARLDEALESTAQGVRRAWNRRRSDLLSLGDLPVVQRRLAAAADAGSAPAGAGDFTGDETVPEELAADFASLGGWAQRVVIRDIADRPVWTLQALGAADEASEQFRVPALAVRLEIYGLPSGRRLGALVADLPMTALTDEPSVAAYAAGMVMAAFDPATGASLLPLPFDPVVLANDRFVWGGDDWRTARTELVQPAVALVVAAPLAPLAQPFERAARQGLLALLAVALFSFALAALLTGRVTRSLARLTTAAEAVAQGELERRAEDAGHDEVGRVGRAFNTMTESLRRTLRELADRQALAAVGEFAASLSHEIRNALTSIRVDLQLLDEEAPDDASASEIRSRALQKVTYLNRTVSDALSLARSGRVGEDKVDLDATLQSAAQSARPEFEARGAKLQLYSGASGAIEVKGDRGALEQLFLNLLLNAAQALDNGGSATVDLTTEEGVAVVSIRDTGAGIPEDLHERVFEPFFSTRPGGTGLGLAIARRSAQAHGGRVALRSSQGSGTTVEVRLPLAPPEDTSSGDSAKQV
jgi:signal transduction histidine kinase